MLDIVFESRVMLYRCHPFVFLELHLLYDDRVSSGFCVAQQPALVLLTVYPNFMASQNWPRRADASQEGVVRLMVSPGHEPKEAETEGRGRELIVI